MDKFELMAHKQAIKDLDRELGRLHELLIYSTNEGDCVKLEILSQKRRIQDRLIELTGGTK